MSKAAATPHKLSPDLLLRAYAAGIFPMAESSDDPSIFWVEPKSRGILPLNSFHVSKSLRKFIRKATFEVRFDTAFEDVMKACAQSTPEREETWINQEILQAYTALHHRGFAHSVECWQDDKLVGGLYGVSLGAAFFGESMFSRSTNASKVALVYLVARLRLGAYRLLDTQFITDHLLQFGAIEIPNPSYLDRLEDAVNHQAVFPDTFDSTKLKEMLELVMKPN